MPAKGGEATSTLLNCLWARFVTGTQDLGGKGPREAGGAPSASRATASEAPKGVYERRVCAHTSVCMQHALRVSRSRYLSGWVWAQCIPHLHAWLPVQAYTCVRTSVLAAVLVCVLYVSLSVCGSVHSELLSVNTSIYTCMI